MTPLARRAGITLVSMTALLAPLAPAAPAEDAAAVARTTLDPGRIRTLADYAWHPDVVVDASGGTTVVWGEDHTRGRIMARHRPAGEAWQEPVVLGRGARPVLGVDAEGDLTAAWNTNRKGHTTGVAAAVKPADGEWQPPVALSADKEAPRYNPYLEDPFGAGPVDLAVGPDGTAVAAWHWGSYQREKPFRVEVAYRGATGVWGDREAVTDRTWSGQPQVALDAAGAATVLYLGRLAGPGDPLRARSRDLAGVWSSPTRLTGDGRAYDVAMTADGSAFAVFGQGSRQIRGAYRPAAGAWSASQRLDPMGADTDSPRLGIDGSGTAVVVWARNSGRVEMARSLTEGAWSEAALVATKRNGGQPLDMAVDAAGDVFVFWGLWQLVGRYGAAGGGWSDLVAVTPADRFVQDAVAAVHAAGDVEVVWLTEMHALRTRTVRVD